MSLIKLEQLNHTVKARNDTSEEVPRWTLVRVFQNEDSSLSFIKADCFSTFATHLTLETIPVGSFGRVSSFLKTDQGPTLPLGLVYLGEQGQLASTSQGIHQCVGFVQSNKTMFINIDHVYHSFSLFYEASYFSTGYLSHTSQHYANPGFGYQPEHNLFLTKIRFRSYYLESRQIHIFDSVTNSSLYQFTTAHTFIELNPNIIINRNANLLLKIEGTNPSYYTYFNLALYFLY